MTQGNQVLRTETLEVASIGKGTVNLLPPWTKYANDYKVNRDAVMSESEVMETVAVGAMFSFTFVRENLKQGKDPNNAKDFDYWWGIWAVSDPQEGTSTIDLPEYNHSAPAQRQPFHFPDPKGDSIERQVAAKAATDMLIHGVLAIDSELPAGEQWDTWFNHILDRIQGVRAGDGAAQPAAPAPMSDEWEKAGEE